MQILLPAMIGDGRRKSKLDKERRWLLRHECKIPTLPAKNAGRVGHLRAS